MSRGGKREGAGRKKGASNLFTQELRDGINAPKLIVFLQDVAEGKIKDATTTQRIQAATVLLKKIMPDSKQIDIETRSDTVIEIKSFLPDDYGEDELNL